MRTRHRSSTQPTDETLPRIGIRAIAGEDTAHREHLLRYGQCVGVPQALLLVSKCEQEQRFNGGYMPAGEPSGLPGEGFA